MRLQITTIILWLISFSLSFAHSGRTNNEGCHNERASGKYHCHFSDSARSSFKSHAPPPGATPVKNEKFYNSLLAKALNGKTEISHGYTFDGGRSTIRVDVETVEFVIEGGLDKRSSLDSLQQIVFASILTKKKPAIVIYDTDGIEGPYEFRIQNAAETVGVAFFRLNENEIRNLKNLDN